jgi:hypothetical protein
MTDSSWEFSESVIDTVTLRELTFDYQSFAAYQVGRCKRQLYLAKLGLADTTHLHGRFKAGRIVTKEITDEIAAENPHLQTNVGMTVGIGNIRINGCCTAYDPTTNIVYHLITRNGWYRFHPPIQRHLDQLQVYMAGLDASAAQLCYVNLGDLSDVRLWPPPNADSPYLEPDADRVDIIRDRAAAVSSKIIESDVARSETEIPFEKCGCYFCESEELRFPMVSNTNQQSPPHSATPSAQPESLPEPEPEPEAGEAPPFTLPSHGSTRAVVNDYHVPCDLRERRVWVLWDGRDKLVRAPWQDGHMFPAKWSAASGKDPRRTFTKAKMVADLPIREIHRSWPFPDDDLPDEVIPAILLEHEPDDPITVLDFDDVRDPATGEISDEVDYLLDELGGYTEVSRSGTGLHTFVFGALPGDQSMVQFPLRDQGSVECYDSARFVASTWQHVEGTPLDAVPAAEDTIESLLATYPRMR